MADPPKLTGPVALTEVQKQLFDRLVGKLAEITKKIHTARNLTDQEIKELGKAGAELHKSLAESGTPVRHHKYMIENRGIQPDDPEFYEHVHPVEDLIKFVGDQSANDDPEDQTIGHEFTFVVFSRRWGHTDTYRVTRTKTGWAFRHMMGPVSTGKDARVKGQHDTGLFDLLDHDSINYPEELPGYFEWLWERAAEDGLSKEQVQDSLKMLADWVSVVEKHSPSGIFKSYK